MKFKRQAQRIVGKIDLIPLIDVVLLLLIFFILSSRFIFQSVIAVDLPEAITSDIEAQANHTVILTRGGLIFFDGRKVTEEGLNFGLELARSRGRDPLVIIKADEEVPHRQVMKIMGLVKEAGIKRLVLATEPKRE
ncbi:biopolymer transporter ExbD [candidate division NPL-UPA2 bacterium]|nr:biopolymer transporter ExbD [candidate division NPL-UPA2 bacterium]